MSKNSGLSPQQEQRLAEMFALEGAPAEIAELVRIKPVAPAGVKVDPKDLRKGQADLIKKARSVVRDPSKGSPSGPDYGSILKGTYKHGGAHKLAARMGGGSEHPTDAPTAHHAPATSPEVRGHTQASNAAHTASADASEHGRQADLSPSADAAKTARNSHKMAHDAHLAAAGALHKMGHYSMAQDHIRSAKDHAQKAIHYHKMMGHHSGLEAMRSAAQRKKMAAGESVEGTLADMNEQKRLMGYDRYPSLKEAVTLQDLDDFEKEMQSWRYRQRDLMGLESHYPMLSEVYDPPSEEDNVGGGLTTRDTSQGLADTNYQVVKDKADRASLVAFRGLPGAHREAAQAHRAAAKVATNARDRAEHEALAAKHEYHAFRSPETKLSQVKDKVGRAETGRKEGDSQYAMPSSTAGGPVIGVPGGVKEDIYGEFAAMFRSMLPEDKRHPHVGKRVELHPGTDLWMRGARYGTVHSVGKDGHVRVKMDHPGVKKLVRTPADRIKFIEAKDTRDIPASVKHQARSIEKDGGPFKKRRGGAKTRAGIAYAIAWKHHCKKNPGSRHCNKSEARQPGAMPSMMMKGKKMKREDAASDATLARLAKKHGNVDNPHAQAAHDALRRLAVKHGRKQAESEYMHPRQALSALSKMRKKDKKGEGPATSASVLGKLAAKYGESKMPGMSIVDKMKGKKMKRESRGPDDPWGGTLAKQARRYRKVRGHAPERMGKHVALGQGAAAHHEDAGSEMMARMGLAAAGPRGLKHQNKTYRAIRGRGFGLRKHGDKVPMGQGAAAHEDAETEMLARGGRAAGSPPDTLGQQKARYDAVRGEHIEDIQDEELLAAVDKAMTERAKKEAMNTHAIPPPGGHRKMNIRIKTRAAHISPLTGLHSEPNPRASTPTIRVPAQ